MTIRLRLTLWYTALLGAMLILFSIAVYSALATNLRLQTVLDTANQATEVSRAIHRQLETSTFIMRTDPTRIEFPALDFFASASGIQLVGLDGAIYQRSNNLGNIQIQDYTRALDTIREGKAHRFYTTDQNNLSLLVYSVPVMANQSVLAAIQIIQPITYLENTLNQAGRYLIFGSALSLMIAAIGGAFLAQRALAPIDDITDIALGITRTQDLGQRIHIPENKSEVGRLGETFNEMLSQIQQLFLTQERLVADVSHELRTPLTTIQGNVELLQRMAKKQATPAIQPLNGPMVEAYKETLNEIESEAKRMSKMVSDLLLLAQADSGGIQLQMKTVEMDTLLLEVYRQTRRLADLRKGEGAIDVRLGDEDQALVYGDPDRLRQLLLNLAENAVKYTSAGGTVTMGLKNENGQVHVYVQDTGIGISQEDQRQIFSRFYRTDKARSRELGGSGLGLSIVQWIAEAHNGGISVESELHKGSTFTLYLPSSV
ncbi:MAG: HAMP domain-containing sensor histidine kinase [Chloroflexota bacterium]